MEFYTNVKVVGDQVYLRGIDKNGKRIKAKEKYNPTGFIPTKKESKYRTLNGRRVDSFKPGGIRDTRNFYAKYKDTSNFNVYGNDNFAYCFIGDRYADEIDYDISKLVIANIDIEVASDQGFPNVENAGSPVISIALKFNENDFYVFGYDEPEDCPIEDTLAKRNIKYVSCENERDLLLSFLECWNQHSPDIITGWNLSLIHI